MQGGRIDQWETDQESFRREIGEELGIKKLAIIGSVDYYIWLNTPSGAHACGIANLIKNDNSEIRLSSENKSLAWIAEKEINNYKYFWPKSERAIKKAFTYHRLVNKAL